LTWDRAVPSVLDAKPLSGDGSQPTGIATSWSAAPRTPLEKAVARLGVVLRLRNVDLWDALGTAIIRQVIRADQARLMYRRFCAAHGPAVATPVGERHLIPRPEVVLSLPATAFADIGMAFKRPALVAAADAFLMHGPAWAHLAPATLVVDLQQVPRIGPWTAGAAVADWSGDFSVYPYADLAVRTWARRADPSTDWPTDEASFAAYWRDLAGERLSELTQLILAWGGTHVPP
jgi:DNA-3-methyladenine glycosylase II